MLETIKGIVKNLFLPLRKNYETYPILPEQRVYEGQESGSVAGCVKNWYISTDTGCAFIPLDGLSDAYDLLIDADEELARETRYMLGFMMDKFMTIPFTEICVQTHATLTGLRGMMRMFKHTRNHVYLSFVKDTFDLYINEGMTANFANYNWFGRPEWTEPCAIIDSFMLACQLYQETAEQRYADYANYILYNGIYRSQRDNGGFGTDNCAGPVDDYVIPTNYEAYWCCTMRGGEGLFAVSQHSLLEREKDIVMLYPASGIYKVKDITMHIRTDYPKSGNVSITILENNSDKNATIEFLMFRTYVDVKFLHNFKQRKVVITKDKNVYHIDFKLPIYYKLAEGKHNKKDKKLFMRGPAIMGSLSPITVPRDLGDIVMEEFIPLYDTSFTKPRNRVEKEKIYILYDGQ
ncbi:MAG: hypothetical protein GX166_11495 [Clostridiaceae bacterium]|nr:hypothetical protein [Clostridiaceae bacterium]